MEEPNNYERAGGCLPGGLRGAAEAAKGSMVLKLVVVGAIVLLLQIPLLMIHGLNSVRQALQRSVTAEVSTKWGGEQCIGGPVLTFGTTEMRETVSAADRGKTELRKFPVSQTALPDGLEVSGVMAPEVRTRGIYQVLLHSTKISMKGRFVVPPRCWASPGDPETLECFICVPDPKGLRTAELRVDGKAIPLQPGMNGTFGAWGGRGLSATLAAADWAPGAEKEFTLELVVNGSGALTFLPMGRNFALSLAGSWPSPSFTGAMLPDTRRVDGKGFEAEWHVMEMNRTYPQSWKDNAFRPDSMAAVGTALVLPASHYQQVERATKYSALFIIIVLVGLLIAERASKTPVHPVQYFVASLALVMFYMLLLTVAERMGFPRAYAVSTAVISLMTFGYCLAVFRKAAPAIGVGVLMVAAYGVIYAILQLEDMALLAGTIVLLMLLAVLMAMTAGMNHRATKNE